jgi:hypothetical protein
VRYRVESRRMEWADGAVIPAAALAGCNIGALLEAGHLSPVKERAVRPKTRTAEEPEEHN